MGTLVSSPQGVWQGNETYTWANKGVWTFLNDCADCLYLMLVPACLNGVWMTSLGFLQQSSGSQLCTRELLCSQLQLLTWDWHTAQRSFDSCHVGDGYQFGTSAALSLLWDIGIKPVANILSLVLEFYKLCPACNSYCKLWTYNSCRFGGDFQGLCNKIPLSAFGSLHPGNPGESI